MESKGYSVKGTLEAEEIAGKKRTGPKNFAKG